ncbi:pupal cuticle protein Edg-91-like, partial [Heptranchias perlo]|uniref:pupal cuticle protein Edg-91-like n=1 Tax=Heptranchias perlo TaxID=212740 RepID=UPI00355A2732
MWGLTWLQLSLLLCLGRLSLQRGLKPHGNGALGRMFLPSMGRGAGIQPDGGAPQIGAKGLGPYGLQNGYRMGPGQGLRRGGLGMAGKGPKPAAFGAGTAYPLGARPMGVPGGLGGKRKPGYGVPGNGFPTGYQNGYINGQGGRGVPAGRGKPGKAPGYANGAGRYPAAGLVQPAFGNGYRNGNGYANGFANGFRNGFGVGVQPSYGNGTSISGHEIPVPSFNTLSGPRKAAHSSRISLSRSVTVVMSANIASKQCK